MSKKLSGQGAALTIAQRALAFVALAISPISWAHAQASSQPMESAAAPAATNISPAAPATSTDLILPANTVIELEMVDAVSSKTSQHGDLFKLRVAADVKSGTTVVIPAGTPAVGQVVHAEKSHGGGKAGELILAARYVDLPQGQIKLHSSFGAAGKDRSGASMATSIAFGVFGFFVKGKEIEIPAGSPLSARVAMDTSIAVTP
jgi:hypothetical protein